MVTFRWRINGGPAKKIRSKHAMNLGMLIFIACGLLSKASSKVVVGREK